jgi:hypothetical protein
MKHIALTIVLVCTALPLAFSSQAAAQDDDQACDPAGLIQKVAAMKSSGDPRSDLAELGQLAEEIKKQQEACTEDKLDALTGGKTQAAAQATVALPTAIAQTIVAIKAQATQIHLTRVAGPQATETPVSTLSRVQIAAVTRTAIAESRMATNAVRTATAVFIAEYKPIDRRELASYPNRHIGEKVVIRGRVFNVAGEYAFQMFLANSYDAVVVRTRDPLEGIYDNTVVRVYGTVAGTWTGANAFGAEIEQPLIEDAVVVKQ